MTKHEPLHQNTTQQEHTKAPVKLLLLGGFLGSGKTTLMLKLARILEAKSLKVALVTNDQGTELVDTKVVQAQGFTGEEITGGCFCCQFSTLLETLQTLVTTRNPDIIIAEAVGSCTDLMATVIRPIQEFHAKTLRIAGFWGVADGYRLQNEYAAMELLNPMSPIEVLIAHQLKETALLIQTKLDLLSPTARDAGKRTLQEINPKAHIVSCSAFTGEGIPELVELLLSNAPPQLPDHSTDIDYKIYAEAEAAYGWYNGSWRMNTENPVSPQLLGMYVLIALQPLERQGVSIAHAKVCITTPEGSINTGLAGGIMQADIAYPLEETRQFSLVLNIRAACQPELLKQTVAQLLQELPEKVETSCVISQYEEQLLIPSAPNPEYHLS